MHASLLPVRTRGNAPGNDATFHDLMAERLRQAPWLALSAALHAALLVLIWLLLPPEVRRAITNSVAVATTEAAEVVEPKVTPPPETKPEPLVEQPAVSEDMPVNTEPAFDQVPSDSTAKQSSFDADNWNTAIGMGPGAGGLYGDRPGGGKPGGGSSPAAPAISRALTWLVAHQDDDGKWDCDGFMKHDDPALLPCDGAGNAVHDVGVTGLALLAFLGEGSTLRSGPYREPIRRAATWLRGQQQDNGLFGQNSSHDFIYDHAIATYAMVEACGLSNYKLLQPTAQRALNHLEAHRNPYGVWRYQPRDNDNDTSVTGWCIMAYESAKHFGLAVNDGALQLAANWLDQVSEPSGVHGYTKAGEPSSRKPGGHATRFPTERGAAMTAVGLFCRFFLGQNPKEKAVMRAAANVLLAKPPVWDEKSGAIDHYYWYYATYALFQAGGPQWTTWQKKIETALVGNQHKDPRQRNLFGSWNPVGVWGEDGGRVYSTAILALTLQANYRYTRLLR